MKKPQINFRKIAGAITLAFAAVCHAAPASAAASAPLTEGERAFVQSIFGDEVKTEDITKIFFPDYKTKTFSDGRRAFVAADVKDGKHISFYGPKFHAEDYSRESVDNFGNFIHEITHILQFQKNGWKDMQEDHSKIYTYSLVSGNQSKGGCGIQRLVISGDFSSLIPGGQKLPARFDDFCAEQQAAIIEDYARRFLHPEHRSKRIKNTPENDALLQAVVENKFPRAREARLVLEKKEQQEKIKAAPAPAASPSG